MSILQVDGWNIEVLGGRVVFHVLCSWEDFEYFLRSMSFNIDSINSIA